jgi:hypothetical protein
MARALLNVPHLAETPQTLGQRLWGADGYQATKKVRGYYIDWVVTFEKYEISHGDIIVTAGIPGAVFLDTVKVALVPAMLEVVEGFVVGQLLRLRGILTEIFVNWVNVNYADFTVEDSPEPPPEVQLKRSSRVKKNPRKRKTERRLKR